MLLSFRFANHRSFRDEQQLNLTPVYGTSDHSSVPNDAVRVVGIFGANASGKSNSLHALAFMRRLATRSDREVEPGLGLSREPFRLDPDSINQPSRYVVDLLLGSVRYTYGFTISNERVLEEWLYYYPVNRKRKVFERELDQFTWGEESGKRGELERIAEITAPTALFLSTSARFGPSRLPDGERLTDPLHETYRWFSRMRGRARPGPRWPRAGIPWPDSEDARSVIVKLLRAADIGIVKVTLKSPDPGDAEIARRLRDPRPRLQFAHRGPKGNVMLEIDDESTGTQQLLGLAMDASIVLRAGGIMTVDEIDSSLHPMLTAKLIGLFQNPVTNPLGSQIVFTSHDAALLGTFDTEEVLLRDQIWFTEKDDEGASILYPLSDFKPRKDGENRQRRYLNGNYGAVPDLSADLFEQALAMRGEFDDRLTS